MSYPRFPVQPTVAQRPDEPGILTGGRSTEYSPERATDILDRQASRPFVPSPSGLPPGITRRNEAVRKESIPLARE
jgi:hypothetical protein